MAIEYPRELPAPISSKFKPADRIRRTDMVGEQVTAPKERDFRGQDEVSFLFTAIQAQRFDDWWRYELLSGGLLWTAPWPLPTGFRDSVSTRRFVGDIQWSFVAARNGGLRNLTASTEVLGRYLPVQGGYDARADGWPGEKVDAVIEDGALIRDTTIPWQWDTLPAQWAMVHGWDGQIAYVQDFDLGAVRETWGRVDAVGVRTPVIQYQASADGVTWTDLAFLGTAHFSARHVRIRITAPGATPTLTAAHIYLYQRP